MLLFYWSFSILLRVFSLMILFPWKVLLSLVSVFMGCTCFLFSIFYKFTKVSISQIKVLCSWDALASFKTLVMPFKIPHGVHFFIKLILMYFSIFFDLVFWHSHPINQWPQQCKPPNLQHRPGHCAVLHQQGCWHPLEQRRTKNINKKQGCGVGSWKVWLRLQ